MSYHNFTSLPPDQEATFIVYEARTQESAKKAMTIGLVTAAIFGLLIVLVVFSHDKPKNKMEGEDMGMLSDQKERDADRAQLKGEPAPAPAAPAAPAPAETPPAPAEAPPAAPAPTTP